MSAATAAQPGPGPGTEVPAAGFPYALRRTVPGRPPEPVGWYPAAEAAMLAATGTSDPSGWYPGGSQAGDCIRHMTVTDSAGLFADWEITGPDAAAALGRPAGPVPGQPLAVQVHALRTLAGIVEAAGIPGLDLRVGPAGRYREIEIEVPAEAGSPAERTAAVARLAGVPGAAVREKRGSVGGWTWICADTVADGHRVHVFTGILAEDRPSGDPEGDVR